MKHLLISLLAISYLGCTPNKPLETTPSVNDLVFTDIATLWDEGMPLGNATIGALVWQKDSALRMSLDRIDLWDLRPIDSLSGSNYNFRWVQDQVIGGDYRPVQEKFDVPYDNLPAPSKIPGAALEFPLGAMGGVKDIRLTLADAVCEITWQNGAVMQSFVHATEPRGWFRIEGADPSFVPTLVPPKYNPEGFTATAGGPVDGLSLRSLGYEQGSVETIGNRQVYHQQGWGDFHYDVVVDWTRSGDILTGVWSISSSIAGDNASQYIDDAMATGIAADYTTHKQWWDKYWAASTISIPDKVLGKQYFNEMYKFGSAARETSYPIALQAVWTADNGSLPPWKGDFHHDLNTQLSYWPCYTGNHLTEGMGYLNTLWDQREANRRYTKQYFGVDGLNVPGVETLTGEPMGGWIQYAMSPTVASWLSQHFYLHWKYSADNKFLIERGYPYVKEVATFLENISVINDKGQRTLPISSSPEIYDNSIKAWFRTITNYDLGLMKFALKAATEMAAAAGLPDESTHWAKLSAEMPEFALDTNSGLMFAEGFPYNESHRHFSNAMAFHPLSLIDWNGSPREREIITGTIENLDRIGPDAWCGYSYSWLGNMKARAMDGDGAAKTLRIFAENFCLRNTFHANGDQNKAGYSTFTYRPFTLEGNFAFASGVQEMLLQSHTGVVRIFPAIPSDWADASFDQLRTMGAFLVSAKRAEGKTVSVTIKSEAGGTIKLADPFDGAKYTVDSDSQPTSADGVISIDIEAGKQVTLSL